MTGMANIDPIQNAIQVVDRLLKPEAGMGVRNPKDYHAGLTVAECHSMAGAIKALIEFSENERRGHVIAASSCDTLQSIITDIRLKTGVGMTPMLSELGDAIVNKFRSQDEVR